MPLDILSDKKDKTDLKRFRSLFKDRTIQIKLTDIEFFAKNGGGPILAFY